MRICIDLDGVVCRLREEHERYEDLTPVDGAIDALNVLKEAGHTVILYTAWHMKTCNGNVGLVLARQGRVTLEWLERHGVPYDEIHFGKPHADVYIDDNAFRFTTWDEVLGADSLPPSQESGRA